MQDSELLGGIDSLPSPQSITGWIRRADGAVILGAKVAIYETGSGLRLGSAPVDQDRGSPPGARGFQAPLRRPVTLAELQQGQVQVRVRLPGGKEQVLAAPAALAPPVQRLGGLRGGFLAHCQQQGFTFQPRDHQGHTDLALELPCAIEAGSIGRNVSIGGFTGIYGRPGSSILNARVGRFCSIADGFTIGPEELPTGYLSTSALQFTPNLHEWDSFATTPRQAPLVDFAPPGLTSIGHDVWVGAQVLIRQGVSIGHGAVLAAGAVVEADVAPYTVVGGVPARVIRQRFDDAMVERLLALQWWNYNILAVPNLRFDVIGDAVSLLEDKLAAGALAPLPVRQVTLGELHAGWIAATAEAEPPKRPARPPRRRPPRVRPQA